MTYDALATGPAAYPPYTVMAWMVSDEVTVIGPVYIVEERVGVVPSLV
jgi:hypothetical protein